MISKAIDQRTLRHPSLQHFRNKNAVIGLIILEDGTDRPCRSTQRSIQHVHILCLEWRIETIRRRLMMMINWLIRSVSSLVHNGFSTVEIDSPNNWSMRQVHEICPIRETKLPSRISSPQHCSIHLEKQSMVSSFILSGERTWDNTHNAIRNAELPIELFRIVDHLVKHLPWFVVMRGRDAELFNLEQTIGDWWCREETVVEPFRIDALEIFHACLDRVSQLPVGNR